MARFYGKVGFGQQVEVSQDTYDYQVTERYYYGDVIRNALDMRQSDKINYDLSTGNSISIISNGYADANFNHMIYLEWMGVLWTIRQVEVQRPRLIIRLGEVYNGPTPKN